MLLLEGVFGNPVHGTLSKLDMDSWSTFIGYYFGQIPFPSLSIFYLLELSNDMSQDRC